MWNFERRYQNVDDFRIMARKRMPKIFADYVDGGALSETTLTRNTQDFAKIAIRQRVLHELQSVDLGAQLWGRQYALPFGPGPVGFQGLFRRGGDIATAKAAEKFGVPFVLSTFSVAGPETITQETGTAPQFQIYLDKDPENNARYLDVCRKVGVDTLFLTVDTCVTSNRERDGRNGFRAVGHLTPQMIFQIAQKPLWALDMLRAGNLEVELIKGQPEFGKGALAQASALSSRLDKSLTWDTVRQLRKNWGGKLVIKGIADVDDAIQARKEDIDGIVLSNHGGRQLDHGLSTISLVSDIREALGPEKMLYVDSGFRRGSDIVKAMALGADFVLLGRPFTWSMAAEGQRGVEKVFDILKTEMEITLQLMGMSSLDELKAQGASALKFL